MGEPGDTHQATVRRRQIGPGTRGGWAGAARWCGSRPQRYGNYPKIAVVTGPSWPVDGGMLLMGPQAAALPNDDWRSV
ncbi:hypothetical protein [Micromonospora parva]|uniref:hypothetical protein n=1 Tax=Micromonospora parva TaxID=1464048 RepID=UPI00365846E4